MVYLGSHANATSAAAQVAIPTLTVFEKSGSFVNQQFRLQKFASAVPGLAGATDDRVVLDQLFNAVGGESSGSDLASVWAELSAQVPVLANTTYANLPATGLLLDGAAWSSLEFPEGASLHFQPAAAEATA